MVKGQAERLFPLLEELLAEAGLSWRDLDRIGVGIGPGNFTGIRISVASARGLALSLGIPAIGVSSFSALGHGLDGKLIASVDARSGRCYLQDLSHKAAPVMLKTEDAGALLDGAGYRVVGYDADALAASIGATAVSQPIPVAVAIAQIAASRDLDQCGRPAPLYIRPADAAPPRDPAPVILP